MRPFKRQTASSF